MNVMDVFVPGQAAGSEDQSASMSIGIALLSLLVSCTGAALSQTHGADTGETETEGSDDTGSSTEDGGDTGTGPGDAGTGGSGG
jgi:hypothetical protein